MKNWKRTNVKNNKPSFNLVTYFKKTGKIKYIFLVYLLITISISILLYLPISHNDMKAAKADFDYSDALFIAASAFSDTGLSTLNISLGFNELGQAIIAVAILIGGFGFFTLKLYIFQLLFGWMWKKTSYYKRDMIQLERGSTVDGDTTKLIKVSLTVLFITLFASIIFMTLYFYFSPAGHFDDQLAAKKLGPNTFNPFLPEHYNPNGDFIKSLRYGIFESISALNNAGFDIIGPASINAYYNAYGLQLWIMLLIFIGGVGYPSLYDFYNKIVSLRNGKKYRFSLFTKLNLITYLCITIIGITLTFIFETTSKNDHTFWNQDEYGSIATKSFAIIFHTMSTRSAGFATIDYYHFTNQTTILHAILMFIGFAPASTAGGIRNITISIIFLSVYNTILGRNNIVAFHRRIGKETLIKAVNILTIAMILVIIGSFIVSTSVDYNPIELNKNIKNYSTADVFFEVTSAFGSSGLSTGLTEKLNLASKLTLIIYMFIGQLGITSTILVWGNQKHNVNSYTYIYEDVSLG
ncbi:TrkH family potassium uptake protein [Mycoplasma phocoenae]|uniref:TrkH family potassium uptake protein n=1 Tax=Mycoplasma phocoenae TaxID=754517 RepID=A0A858U4T9_9MOLU|nr:TrkH family potassium uptake protein [Mycoplasma phocoenae]QJG67089.1 TrkH family potassium uptake protein [Mycoplasma phocoenae]